METVKYVIKDPVGLHARPAAQFVKFCATLDSKVTLKKGDIEADAKSMLGILKIAAKQGDELTIELEGGDETRNKGNLETYLSENL
jgi:phosphocarrier protein